MGKMIKISLVLGGFIAALVAAGVAVYIHGLQIPSSQSQAASGMVAGGDLFLFLFVFAVLSIIPIALALYFLRSNLKFWKLFSVISLVIAATGPLAIATSSAVESSGLYQKPFWVMVDFLDLLRACGTIVFAVGFGIFAIVAPQKRDRWFLLAAAGIEGATFLYLVVHFLLWDRIF